MNELELQLRVSTTIKQYIGNLMAQNQIPANIMENAINSVLLDIKDAARQELAASLLAAVPQEKEEKDEIADKETDNG
jgi:hypothetical protein